MKITDVKTYITMPIENLPWLFVEVHTDEGITGLVIGSPAFIFGFRSISSVLVGKRIPKSNILLPSEINISCLIR